LVMKPRSTDGMLALKSSQLRKVSTNCCTAGPRVRS
jgi:hypothetical protein